VNVAAAPFLVPSQVDPALPRLSEAVDTAAAGRLFAGSWEGRPDGELLECTRIHARWSPGVECAASYRLVYSDGNRRTPTLGAVRLDADGIGHWLYTDDAAMPGLADAADPVVMSVWLGARTGSFDACTVVPIRYRPARRCVLRYGLGSAGVFYGKVDATRESARTARVIAALGGYVPSLLGFAEEWQLLVQRDAGEESLRSLPLSDARSAGLLRATGRLLARLHGEPGPAASPRTLEDDACALDRYLAVFERACPGSLGEFARAIERIKRHAQGRRPLVPSHGALRLDQVHICGGSPLLIDLDTYCHAEAERDVANLVAYLRWREIRGAAPPATVSRARQEFLAGYADGASTEIETVRLAVFEAASLLKIAGRRCRALAVEQWALLPRLVDAANRRLDAAEAPA
jgi:Phosphotransferase enzyme family